MSGLLYGHNIFARSTVSMYLDRVNITQSCKYCLDSGECGTATDSWIYLICGLHTAVQLIQLMHIQQGLLKGKLLCSAFDFISAQTKRGFFTRHRVEGCQVKGRPDIPLDKEDI